MRDVERGGSSGLRNTLMAVEVALAMVVLLAGGLFFRSFDETRETDTGFTREGMLLAAYDLSGKNIERAAARDFASRLLTRLRAVPDSRSGSDRHVRAARHPRPAGALVHARGPRADRRRARSGALEHRDARLLQDDGHPVREGERLRAARRCRERRRKRSSTASSCAATSSGLEPVGRRLSKPAAPSYTIVGVVRTSLYDAFGESPLPIIYLSYRDRPSTAGEIHVRTRVGAETLLAPEIERRVRALDPALPVYDVRTMNDHIEKNLFLRRIPARMFVVLGPMLLVLAAIGIYAVVGYTVSRRTNEIGVRLALGATAAAVVRQIVGESLRVIGVGVVAGWSVAFIVAVHVVQGGRIDAVVFAGVPRRCCCCPPAPAGCPRGGRPTIDPMAALRDE